MRSFRLKQSVTTFVAATLLACIGISPAVAGESRNDWQEKEDQEVWGHGRHGFQTGHEPPTVQLGPRPYYLVDDMDDGRLKDKLESCSDGPFRKSDFSIGHRGGGTLQFPEETRQSFEAGARMGAGILECDVVFTKDKELVCRHDQCDLHTTTNILAIPELAAKCSEKFTPYDPVTGKAASAKCCASDITLAEFKSLCGKMDGFNPKGTTPAEYMAGTPSFRTDLYATCGEVLSHKESIKLIKSLGGKFTPELKTPAVAMPFQGTFTQQQLAQKMIEEYKDAHVNPRDVWAQSFDLNDVLYWLRYEPRFGRQAVYLDARVDIPGGVAKAIADMRKIANQGVRIIAPPMWTLLAPGQGGKIVPSDYAKAAKAAGLDIIAWTLERSGPLASGGGYYYQSLPVLINNDGDTYAALDVLAKQVGVLGIFSDWSATVTYYADCMGLK